MSSRTSAIGLTAFGICLNFCALPAVAADLTAPYDPGLPVVQQKVEFGSGWYIRGDLGFERTTATVAPSAAVPMVASTPVVSSGNLNGYSAGIGGGYQFNNWIRVDLLAETRRPITASAGGPGVACPVAAVGQPAGGPYTSEYFQTSNCTPNSTVSISRYDALANVYIDLGTWFGVTPYVGGGVGAAFGHESGSTTWTQSNNAPYNVTFTDALSGATYQEYWDRANGHNYVNFAWAGMAGFAYDLTDRLKLDIGYRYFNAGKLSNPAGSSVPLTSQDVRAGLRYLID